MTSESASWSQGYVSDTAYTDHFCAELAPAHLNYIAALNGCDVKPLSAGFNYCELGCGPGQTVNILAASNPDGRFYAFDFNPTHVVAARKLMEAGAVSNLTVLERSFEELAAEDLPDFDFITLHGVWSWVSGENRRRIVEFIYRKLKPGGLVYVSYNALPGWASVAPLQRMMRAASEGLGGTSIDKVRPGFAFLKQLHDVQAQYFVANAAAGPFLAQLSGQDPSYLAHEYLNHHWNPFYSTDVAKELGAAKLTFVGSATAIENHHVLMMPKAMVDLLAQQPSRELSELAKDYMINQRFRRDVFMRGGPASSAPKLADMPFGLSRPKADIVFKLRGPLAEHAFDGPAVRATANVLGEGPRTLADLAAHREMSPFSEAQLTQAVMVLVASGQAMPCTASRPNRSRSNGSGRLRVPLALNRAIVGASFSEPQRTTLASPLAGNGMKLDLPSRLFLGRMADHAASDPSEEVWKDMKRHDIALTRDGRMIEGRADSVRDLRQRFERFKEKTLPSLIYQGVAEAG